jgi:accessory gene regulator B
MQNIFTFKFIDAWSIYCAKRLYEPIKDKPEILRQLKVLIENIKHVTYDDNELNEQSYIDIFQYAFKAIYGAIIKGGLLLLIASLLNILVPTLVVTASFGIIRVFAGGLHFKSYTLCTYVSLICFLIGGVIGSAFKYNLYINIIVYIFALTNFLLYAPVENENLPIKPHKKIIFKRIAIVNTTILLLLNTIFLYNISITVGVFIAGLITLPIFNSKFK